MSCARSFEQSGLATPEKVLFCTTLHLLDQNLFKQFHLDSLFCTTTEDQKTQGSNWQPSGSTDRRFFAAQKLQEASKGDNYLRSG
jgi:hypothetical protein